MEEIPMKQILILMAIVALSMSLSLLAEQKTEKKVPDFSQIERSKIPVEFTWKLDDIYASEKEWKADKAKVVEMVSKIEESAKGWTSSADKMLDFMRYMDRIQIIGMRLFQYSSHHSNMNLADARYQKMKAELQTLFVQFGAKTTFIRSDVLKLGEKKFMEYVKAEPELKPYKMGIDTILRTKDHILSPDKEKIMAMTGLFAGSAQQASMILNNVELPRAKVKLSDGKEYTLNYQTYARLRESKSPEDREKNMLTFWENHKKFEKTLAILMNSEIKKHHFSAQIRSYKSCLDAALFGNNIDLKVYRNLILTVKANLKPLHDYLIIKKELLGLKTFKYADMYASAVAKIEKEYTYDEAKDIILKAMEPMGTEYVEALNLAFDNRWIDIYPNLNKQSGAYSSSVYGVHPFIKMNFVGNYNSVSTLAHELGHSMHSFFSNKTQHYATHDYPIFLAEIASTFNENLLMEYLLKTEDDDFFKLYLLDNYINGLKGTLYRQVLFAEFELAMHEQVEKNGTLDADWLNEKYLALTREYYGHDKGICVVDDYIQNEWSTIPHFYYNFYVYQYSTGIIASMALTDNVLTNGKPARDRYLKMLKSGGSKYPLELLKEAGVDMLKNEPMEVALKRVGKLVDEMKKLVKKLKKEGRI